MVTGTDVEREASIEATAQKPSLPRLVYVGSLAVEATSAGQMQLYRVLRDYPADRLAILETECAPSQSSRRIPHVHYYELGPAVRHGWGFIRRRLSGLYWHALNFHASWQARRAKRLIGPFQP